MTKNNINIVENLGNLSDRYHDIYTQFVFAQFARKTLKIDNECNSNYDWLYSKNYLVPKGKLSALKPLNSAEKSINFPLVIISKNYRTVIFGSARI